MKKLNITKERFEKSRYFQNKYGKLKYVSESGRLFKTNKGKVLKFNEGTFWPTPENERIPVYTIELSRIDDDEAYVETPMKYSKIYHSDEEAFEDAEKLADEYANEDGKFEVHVMAGEYQIGDGEDIYGDPYVDGSIQTGLGWKKAKMVNESYEVSPEIEDRLNSILADEFLAAEFYRLAELAMKGKKQHLLSEIAEENGEDELEDHFKNLSEWMQSKGLRVVTNHDEMLDITGATVFTVEDGDSTEEIVDKLIQSEEEAIEAYENLIPETDLDLRVMLCGFLKDEREHLKELMDCRDEMGGESPIEDREIELDDEPEENEIEQIDEGTKMIHKDKPFRVRNIDWDADLPTGPITVDFGAPLEFGDEKYNITLWLEEEYDAKVLDFDFKRARNFDEDCPEYAVSNIEWDANLPKSVVVNVPYDVVDAGYDEVEEYISDYLSDKYGFCHYGFECPQLDRMYNS